MSDPFAIETRVYYEDTDAGGIVYHSNYLKYMERARSEWFWSHGFCFDEFVEHNQVLFVLHHADINWRRPARLKDRLRCTCQVTHVGRTSITFEQTITHTTDPSIVYCTGTIRVVCISPDGKVKPIPSAIKEILT